MSTGRGGRRGKSLRPWPGDAGGDLRLSLCSGVFSDGNFTYIVEPREMARPQEPPQVSPSRSPLTALLRTHTLLACPNGCRCLLPW